MFPGAPGRYAAMLETGGVLYAVPSVLADIVRRAERHQTTFEAVTHVITAGEKLSPELRAAAPAAFPHARVFEYYGASELGFVTVLDDEAFAAHPRSVGRPFLGTDVRILDKAGHAVAPGTVGLLCADTDYGFDHYWGSEKQDITHGGVPTVGDLAWADTDGFVYLAGRRDNMLVVRGENVYPEQVELELLRLPGVVHAAVVGEPIAAPEHLVAFVVLEPGTVAHELQPALRVRLPARLVPRRIVPVSSLPMTSTGKVARMELVSLLA
jgi:acyl-CoA synthetase (AMP-forming)/AMP-acid ligase II